MFDRIVAVALIVVTAAVLVIAVKAAAHVMAGEDRTPDSCDGKPADFHAERAKRLIDNAYALERWEQPVLGEEKRAWRSHTLCLRDLDRRDRIRRYADRKAEAFDDYRAYRVVTPYDGPNGTHWAIPWYVVSCESYGGSWSASNGSHVGPYQLAWNWNPPWPVTSFADQLAHHRIARMLWTTYGSSQWACA